MRATPSPSPERKWDYGIQATPSPSPQRMQDFGMQASLSPSAERMWDFGVQATLSPSPGRMQDIDIQATHSPLPVTKHKSNFGMQEPLSPEPQDAIRAQAPPPSERQGFAQPQRGDAVRAVSPLPHAEEFGVPAVPEEGPSQISSSSKAHGEFNIISSYMNLTLAHTVWKWGELPPSSGSSEQEGQTGAHESVH
jgi:hypothetical protein